MRAQRIALTISSLACGGAERTIVNLTGAFAAAGCSVTVITTSARDSDFFALDPRVQRVRITSSPAGGRTRHRVAVFARLRDALHACTPDVAVSLTERVNIATLSAAVGLDVPVVVSERIDPRRHDAGRTWSALRRLLYPRAAALVVQTQAIAPWAARLVGTERVRVIPNAVVPAPAEGVPALLDGDGPLLLAIGRLCHQKGFDLLLDAFARATHARAAWRLLVLGEGPQRAALEAQVAARGLRGRVRFPGTVPDVFAYLRRADAFVLSSRYEGFPNVLLEAMCAGRPVVAYACDSGPAEIVHHDEDGLLVAPGNVGALAAALARVMDDRELRDRLGAAAQRNVQRFAMERVLPEWARVLDEAMR